MVKEGSKVGATQKSIEGKLGIFNNMKAFICHERSSVYMTVYYLFIINLW